MFKSFSEIELKLKQFDLERKIALEELKATGHKVNHDIKPLSFAKPIVNIIKTLGFAYLTKKLFR